KIQVIEQGGIAGEIGRASRSTARSSQILKWSSCLYTESVYGDPVYVQPKTFATSPHSSSLTRNNIDVGDQDGFVPVNHRRHRERKQTATTTAGSVPGNCRSHGVGFSIDQTQSLSRRRMHLQYANILRTLKATRHCSKQSGAASKNIRRSAAGALVLQLKKNVDNASTLGAKLDQVLDDAATAIALQHTTMIEIKDLDECATKEEIAEALSTSLGAPSLNKEVAGRFEKRALERRRQSPPRSRTT
ncbi:unnamed protein product, partial [Trichogramma brassicae]